MGTFNSSVWNSQQWNAAVAASGGKIQVSDIIYHAYRIAGVLARAGRGYSQSQYTDGLWELNALIDLWKSDRALVYAFVRQVFTINANQQTYKIGLDTSAGQPDILTQRPEFIQWASYIFNNVTPSVEQPFQLLTPQLWAALSPKDLTSTISTHLYYQPDLPNGTVYLWPISTSPWQGALYLWQNVNEFANPTDVLVIPPAYRDALQWNLGVRLAMRNPEEQKMHPDAPRMAARALQRIQTINAPELVQEVEHAGMGAGPDARGHWSIISNRYI